MKKWLILGLSQGKYKMRLEEKARKCSINIRTGVDLSEGHKSQLEDALNGQSYNDWSKIINNVVLCYNSKGKINLHESILT